jgi:CBS domain-containing protein
VHISKTAISFSDASERNPWKTISENAPLEEVLELLSVKQLHRVAVVNSENSVVGVVSQLGVLSFLYTNFQDNATLKQTKLQLVDSQFSQPLITIARETSVYEAFQVLHSNKISGVPVVDAEGNFLNSFSANDIKVCIESSKFERKIGFN